MYATHDDNLPRTGMACEEREQVRAVVTRTITGPAWKVDQRLVELEYEWPLERVLNLVLSLCALVGTILAIVAPVWLVLVGVAGGLIFLHAVTGWSPGVSVCRAFGLRRRIEIERERYTLKTLRGDFQSLAGIITPQDRESLDRFEDEGGSVPTWTAPDAADPTVIAEALHAVER